MILVTLLYHWDIKTTLEYNISAANYKYLTKSSVLIHEINTFFEQLAHL